MVIDSAVHPPHDFGIDSLSFLLLMPHVARFFPEKSRDRSTKSISCALFP
jgi:hypothetical protein